MEIRIYDADLNFIGLLENQTSLLWRRKYYEPGEFELCAPITGYNIALFKLGRLVWFRGAVDAGIIESLSLKQASDENQIVASGRFLPAYMDRRLIKQTLNFSGTVENAMRQLLSGVVAIPHVSLEEPHGYTERVEFQATYKNLLAYEEKLAQYANYGIRFRPNFTEKTITFEIFQGLDHSKSQHDRSRVIFSERYDNLKEVTYLDNDQLLKNVVYVGGQGEGSARTVVIVGDNESRGLERRELFVNATDISPDDITTAEYLAALRQRGEEALAENARAKSFECVTEPSINFVYGRDYDLGDIVTVEKADWGISEELRITELTEIYENGEMQIEPVFGTPLPEKINWEED